MRTARRPLLKALALGAAALALALLLGWWRVDGPGAEPETAMGARPLPLTEMAFSLTDHEGNPVGPESLLGRPSLVFFGFTHCPDVCPTTLSDISGWLDALGSDAAALNAVFVSVDPERDTPAALAEYVSYFHPQVRGWTGTPDQIAQATRGFRVRTERVGLEGGDYAMDHTASVFLFRADGDFAGTVDYHEPREFAVPKIRRAMNEEPEGAA